MQAVLGGYIDSTVNDYNGASCAAVPDARSAVCGRRPHIGTEWDGRAEDVFKGSPGIDSRLDKPDEYILTRRIQSCPFRP